jgi:hypothetical protein
MTSPFEANYFVTHSWCPCLKFAYTESRIYLLISSIFLRDGLNTIFDKYYRSYTETCRVYETLVVLYRVKICAHIS